MPLPCATMKPMNPLTQKSIPDVLIIGSGFAGLAAAIECATHGLSVTVLEKMKAIGGNSIISDGGIAAPGTDLQHRHGISDSIHAMMEDMLMSAQGQSDPALIRMVCEGAKSAYDWTKDVLGVTYQDRVDIFGGHRVKRCYSPDPLSGSTIILKMRDRCDHLGVDIQTGVYVTALIREGQRICGIVADPTYRFQQAPSTSPITLLAKRAIVIAGGGYAADMSFLHTMIPGFPERTLTTNKRSATAELLRSCMAIGAATQHLEVLQWMPWSTPDEPGYGIGGLFGDYIVSSAGILIDPTTGNRFVNERGDRKAITDRIHATAPWVIGLADHEAVSTSGWNLNAAIEKRIIKTHDALADIAYAYHIPLESLQQTIDHYNDIVTNHRNDDLGKIIEPWMNPINQPPFYTMRIQPKTHYCPGGLVIDYHLHVLDHDRHWIEGLYAVGEVTGTTHGLNRLGSCSITECLVLGRHVATSIQNDDVFLS